VKSFAVPAEAYDRFMGVHSRQLAPQLADLAQLSSGDRALDVGCGPGALTAELVARLGAKSVAAVDPSESFVAATHARHPDADVRLAPAEALPFNQRAVRDRPEDALANAQLGMNYFKLDQFDQAEQYLLAAKRLDPAQFYQPQIFLAEIYSRRGNRVAAVRELEEVLAIRPDGPLSDSIRYNLAQLTAAR